MKRKRRKLINKILHGLDGSLNSFKALEEAIKLAKLCGAELHTISVEEIPRFPETVSEVAEERDSADSKINLSRKCYLGIKKISIF